MHAAEVKGEEDGHVIRVVFLLLVLWRRPRGFLHGGGVDVGFRSKRIMRGHGRGADDLSGDMIGHLPQSR